MNIEKNIYLIGYMGCGKSTLMQQLKAAYNFHAVDLDHYIEENYKMSIPDIFSEFGEDYFREVESKCLKDLSLNENNIISTGGGTPCFLDNLELIKQNGISIYIKVSARELSNRLFPNKETRPILKNFKQKSELESFITQNIKQREQFYEQSDIIIESDKATIVDIIESLKVYLAE